MLCRELADGTAPIAIPQAGRRPRDWPWNPTSPARITAHAVAPVTRSPGDRQPTVPPAVNLPAFGGSHEALPASLVFATPLLTAACGDSSPASPFSGAATLAEEAAGTHTARSTSGRTGSHPLPRLLPDRSVATRYSGSLTTPPFTEPVAWVVLKEPIVMSAGQIEAFRELFEEGNSREPQPLHGRRVVYDGKRLPEGTD